MAVIGRLEDEVVRFIEDASSLDAKDAEERLLPLLSAVLSKDGIELVDRVRPSSQATDYVGVARGDRDGIRRVGVEYKHYRPERRVDRRAVDQVLALAGRAELDRVVLIARPGFTKAAVEAATRDHPVDLQLMDLGGLRSWARRLEGASAGQHTRIGKIITEVSRQAARIIAEHPEELENLEWRDLERMVATVLNGLGFEAELTPASKDGGKDIILTLFEDDVPRSYVVELKHWRSGKHVGHPIVTDFVQVVAREGRDRGLLVATYGYSEDAFSTLTEVDRSRVRFAGTSKVVSLCRTYTKVESGLWTPLPGQLPDLLFAETS